jgi:four helix bundle protein
MPIHSYRDLVVWQKAVVLATDVYRLARGFERRDRTLADQLQRAAVSIPSNVAEGWARGAGRSYRFHLRVALGSEAELQTQIEIAIRAGGVSNAAGQGPTSAVASLTPDP